MRPLRRHYASTPAAVARARHDVAAFAADAGAADGLQSDVRLVVSEAVTNAVLHGYRGAPGAVSVVAETDGHELSVLVYDGGEGIGLPTDRPGMGCGLDIIAELAQRMTVRPGQRGGTELRMTFALAAQPLVAAAA
jgi:stage II sporulation protein AB (anti-sigma F factor)